MNNFGHHMLAALTSDKEYGLRAAWLSFVASYTYTRSWDGCEGQNGERMSFGRWYAFLGACSSFWRWLYERRRDILDRS